MSPPSEPTEAETAILAVLWDQGPRTVRQVHEAVGTTRGTGYTTILKLMQIMHDKGLVDRDTSQRSHVYRARVKRAAMQRRLVGQLADRVFAGSTSQLILRALSSGRASAAELEEIRQMLDSLEADA